MANEIDATGKGFLNSSGQIKDKKTLAAEDAKQLKKSDKQREAPEASNDQSVSSALKSVRSRFTDDVNKAIGVVNENDENLKKAGENVKSQLEKAKELKQALKDGDDKAAEEKRAELEQLQADREKLAANIDADNKRLAADRVQTIALGNQQKQTVKIKEVKFDQGEKSKDLEKPKDVNELIDSLEADRDSIKAQRQDLHEVKKEIKTVLKDTRKEIDSIENQSIKSIDEANSRAEKVASDVVKAGSEKAIVSKIDESVVKELLAA
jgi:chromosome segregation ATPase